MWIILQANKSGSGPCARSVSQNPFSEIPISWSCPLERIDTLVGARYQNLQMRSVKGAVVHGAELDHHEQGNASFSGRELEGWHLPSLTPAQRTKVMKILACCHGREKKDQLALLATSTGGLIDDEVRRLACMCVICRFDKPP